MIFRFYFAVPRITAVWIALIATLKVDLQALNIWHLFYIIKNSRQKICAYARFVRYQQKTSDQTSCCVLLISKYFSNKKNSFYGSKRNYYPIEPLFCQETIDRLVILLEGHKATVYARINQQSEVHNAGKEIPALEFILFGNPRAGGRIMVENPIAALDLPLKIIVWEDAEKKVWLAYNKASYLEERYALPHD